MRTPTPALDSVHPQVQVATWSVLHLEEPPEVRDDDVPVALSPAYGTLPTVVQVALRALRTTANEAWCDFSGAPIGYLIRGDVLTGTIAAHWEPCALVWDGTDPDDVYTVHADFSYDNLPDAAALNEERPDD